MRWVSIDCSSGISNALRRQSIQAQQRDLCDLGKCCNRVVNLYSIHVDVSVITGAWIRPYVAVLSFVVLLGDEQALAFILQSLKAAALASTSHCRRNSSLQNAL